MPALTHGEPVPVKINGRQVDVRLKEKGGRQWLVYESAGDPMAGDDGLNWCQVMHGEYDPNAGFVTYYCASHGQDSERVLRDPAARLKFGGVKMKKTLKKWKKRQWERRRRKVQADMDGTFASGRTCEGCTVCCVVQEVKELG